MNKQELFKLIEGPLSAYLMPNGCSYHRFIELLNIEFPELELKYSELYPRLFNLEVRKDDSSFPVYDIDIVGGNYLKDSKNAKCVSDIDD